MKLYFTCTIIVACGFLAMGMQLGLFGNHRKTVGEESAPAVPEKKQVAPRAKFPQELAPAAHAQPVSIAAQFEPGDLPHKMVFLKPSGGLHAWHENHANYHEEWHTNRVEETELIVVVGNSQKFALSHHRYPNGAPPITRYQYNLEASLVEAKTGTVLANRWFHNIPRPVRGIEAWETTALGAPVSYHTVFRWASEIAKNGPPIEPIVTPIVVNLQD